MEQINAWSRIDVGYQLRAWLANAYAVYVVFVKGVPIILVQSCAHSGTELVLFRGFSAIEMAQELEVTASNEFR